MTNEENIPVVPCQFRERKTLTYLRDQPAPRTWAEIQADEAARAKAELERKAKEDAEKLKQIAEDQEFEERKTDAEAASAFKRKAQ